MSQIRARPTTGSDRGKRDLTLIVSGDTAPQRLRDAQAAGLKLLHKPASMDTLTRAIVEELHRQTESPHVA